MGSCSVFMTGSTFRTCTWNKTSIRVHCVCETHLRSFGTSPKVESSLCLCAECRDRSRTQLIMLLHYVRKHSRIHSRLQDFFYDGSTDLHPSFSPNWSCVTLLLLEKTSWLLGNHWFTCCSSLLMFWQSTFCFPSDSLSSMVFTYFLATVSRYTYLISFVSNT